MTIDLGYKHVGKLAAGKSWYVLESKHFVSSFSLKLKIEKKDLDSFNGQSNIFRLSINEVKTLQMTRTLYKSRYNPTYKIKSQTQPSKDNTYNNLPSILQSFKQKLLSGNDFCIQMIQIFHIEMSAVDFQILDDEKIDDSITKRDFIKVYHQWGAKVNSENSNFKFFFGENHKFIQVGNGYLEIALKKRKSDKTNFADGDVVRLVNDAFAYTIHDAKFSTSSGVEIEQYKFVGPISIILRLLAKKGGDLSIYFDIIDESETAMDNSSLKQKLINDHSNDNKCIIRGHLTLEYVFGFCKSLKNNQGTWF